MLLLTTCFLLLGFKLIHHYWKKRDFYRALSKYPTPKGYPLIGNTLSILGSSVDYIKRLDRWSAENEFPFCLWILNRPTVVSARPQDAAAVLNQPGALNRGGIIKKLGRAILGNSLFIADYKEWKPRRKMIASTFNPRILEDFFTIFRKNSDVLVETLENECKRESTFDLSKYMYAMTFNTVCATAMGTDLENMNESSHFYDIYIKAINDTMKISSYRALNFWQQIDWVFNALPNKKKLDEAIAVAHNFSKKIIRQRREYFETELSNGVKKIENFGQNRKVFIDYLLEMGHKDPSFDDNQIRCEVDTFTVGGFETTTISSCFAILLLGQYPEIQDKVYAELIEHIPDPNHQIEYKDLEHLDYLDRFLKEVMRKWGPVTVISRTVTADIKLDEKYTIPRGANFLFWIRSLHFNPDIWPNPQKFDPDRFLREEVAKRPANSYMPYSMGIRNCIGMKYAQIFLKTFIATVLRSYRISSEMKEDDIEIEYAFTIRSKNGYWIQLHKR